MPRFRRAGVQLEIGCRSDLIASATRIGPGSSSRAAPGKAQLFAAIAVGRSAGLSTVSAHSYPMTLMDCKVPNMDAYDATLKMARERALHRSTANAMASDRESRRTAGIGDRVKVSNRAPRSLEIIARSTKLMYCGRRHPKFSDLRQFVGRPNTGA